MSGLLFSQSFFKKTNKFISKVYNYLIRHLLYKLFFKITIKTDGKIYELLFNFYSFLNNSQNRIFFKESYYYNTEMKWRFYDKNQGLSSYGKGFKKRKEKVLKHFLIENLKIKSNDFIIDVGASIGDFYMCFDKEINYYGYEPSPVAFSTLEYNVKNKNLYNLAVSNSDNKNTDFFLTDIFGASSTLPFNKYTNKNFTKKITIETTTLDTIIDKIKNKIKLIKIEAEGSEPEVLQGLKKNINNVEYISIDCGERGIDRESTLDLCCNYLIKNNFKMIDFRPPMEVCLFKNLNL